MEIDSRIDGKTRLMGVIGNPIGHSISPQLHNTINRELGANIAYVPMKIQHENLERAIMGMKAMNFIGFNITVPFKSDVIPFLDVISDEAGMLGAVNTVKILEGKLYGFNTDGEGFVRSFTEEAGTGFSGKKVVLLGAGGASRSIATRVVREGAGELLITNRTLSKAENIAKLARGQGAGVVEVVEPGSDKARIALQQADIIINTTSLGMTPHEEGIPVEEDMVFNRNQIVYDIIYNPMKTRFLQKAESGGCKIINGLGMLFYQGVSAYEIWTERELPKELLTELYKAFGKILVQK